MEIPVEILSAIIGLAIVLPPLAAVWGKRRIVRKLIDAIFDAVDDGKLTEEEYKKVKEIVDELIK